MKYSMFSGFQSNIEEYGFDRALEIAKESGFEGVEFYFSAGYPELIPTPEVAAEYKRKFDAAGIKVPCVSMGANFIRQREVVALSEGDVQALFLGLEFAKILGAPYFHHTLFMGFIFDIDESFITKERMKIFYDAARRVADRARELGITVLYEPQGSIFNGKERFSALLSEMKKTHKNIGVCCDIANSYWVSEDPYPILNACKEDILHVHFKDYLISEGEREGFSKPFFGELYTKQAPVGAGNIDVPAFASLLKSINYSGFISLEDKVNVKSPEQTRGVIKYCESLFN